MIYTHRARVAIALTSLSDKDKNTGIESWKHTSDICEPIGTAKRESLASFMTDVVNWQ